MALNVTKRNDIGRELTLSDSEKCNMQTEDLMEHSRALVSIYYAVLRELDDVTNLISKRMEFTEGVQKMSSEVLEKTGYRKPSTTTDIGLEG